MGLGHLLHKLGEFAFNMKWRVAAAWGLVLLLVGVGALLFFKAPGSDISIPGTEAQKAIDKLAELFPNTGRASGNIVFHTTGKQVSDFQSQIDSMLGEVKSINGVTNAVSPFLNPQAMSADGKTAYAIVQLAGNIGETDKATLDRIAETANSIRSADLQVEQGGALTNEGVGDILGITEILGVVLALAVLIMTFGALMAAGMPLLVALVGIAVSIGGLFALSNFVEINSTTPVLSIMLGLAVGIDYSLFIISKYRSLLLQGYSEQTAAGRAIGTAGNAVIFAAATVVIALAALSVVGIPFLTTMGLAGAAGIAIAAIVSITLTPALFGIAGTGARLFGRKTGARIEAAQTHAAQAGSEAHAEGSAVWKKWGRTLTHRPILAAAAVVVIVGLIAIPAPRLKLGLPSDQYAAAATTERKAYDLLADAFGVGYNAPLIAVVDNVPPVTEEDKATARTTVMQLARQQMEKMGRRMEDLTPDQQALAKAQIEGQVAVYASLMELNKIGARIAENVPNVQSATGGAATQDGTHGIIQIIPRSAPADQATTDLISYLRTNQAQATGSPELTLSITGATALERDISRKLADALPVYLLVVVGLSLILLLIAFRSVLIPIKATLGFLLSVAAMFGAMVAIFQEGLFGFAAPGPLVSFLPIIGIGILFGLAMDYEFFLVSSMHEAYSKTGDAKQAIRDGFAQGAPVVTAAAAIMVFVFAGFIGNHSPVIQAMGFGLAAGIFVDAFLVRMILVPAAMTLLGKSAWWLPSWLNRILPHISIEGEAEEVTDRQVTDRQVTDRQVTDRQVTDR